MHFGCPRVAQLRVGIQGAPGRKRHRIRHLADVNKCLVYVARRPSFASHADPSTHRRDGGNKYQTASTPQVRPCEAVVVMTSFCFQLRDEPINIAEYPHLSDQIAPELKDGRACVLNVSPRGRDPKNLTAMSAAISELSERLSPSEMISSISLEKSGKARWIKST